MSGSTMLAPSLGVPQCSGRFGGLGVRRGRCSGVTMTLGKGVSCRVPAVASRTARQMPSSPRGLAPIVGSPSKGKERTSLVRVGMRSRRAAEPEPEPEPEVDTYAEALKNTGVMVALAAAFGVGIFATKGVDSAFEYAAGYLVEESLSVDNLFVFILLFDFFQVDQSLQKRCLNWGIIGALVMRAVMILAGAEAVARAEWVLLVFAAILLFSSFKLLTEDEDGDEDLSENAVVKFASKNLNAVDYFDGENFFTLEDGVRRATPLLLCLVCIEISDIVFAVDSIPAVFGITRDPFIVYTSNIFAILGLRALYTIVSEAVENLPYLRPAVAIVLGFIGGKMVVESPYTLDYDVSTGVSLAVVLTILGGGIGLSLLNPPADAAEDA